MRRANAILHKNPWVFSQDNLVVSSMIYKYQDLGWKADVHMKKVIFSQKPPTLHQKKRGSGTINLTGCISVRAP